MAGLPRVGDTFGRYRIDDEVGRGGMGVVLGATDTSSGHRVALKVMLPALGDPPELRQRFRREATLLARLRSPHVVEILDHGVQDGCPFIATRYVAGGDLGSLLRARGALPPRTAARVCAQVADALHAAHRAGVVHRDVKPSNVLLDDPRAADPHVWLCDFGIARGEPDGLTVPGSVTGTWRYLAPECGRGAPGTAASDIYALGCLLWAALTGTPPYRGSDVEVAIAHQQAPVPRLRRRDGFGRRADEILARSMAKRPEDRYADAAEVRDALLAAADLAVPATTGPRAGRTRWLVGAAAVLLGGGLLGLGPVVGSGPDDGGAAPAGPIAPVTGDLDGDGYGDLAVRMAPPDGRGGHGAPTYTTWLSDGAGLTERRTVDDTGRGGYRSRVAGDFDGDGRLDVLVSDETAGTGVLRVHGRLSGGGRVDVDLRRATHELVGTLHGQDVDGDGQDDLVIWSRDGAEMVLESALTDGAGGFGRPAEMTRLALPGYLNVEVADLDGDGRADLAVLGTDRAPGAGSLLRTYPGDGSAFLGEGAALRLDTGRRPRMASGDLDGDGDHELLVAAARPGALVLRVLDPGAGAGRPQEWGVLRTRSGRDPHLTGLGVADVDGDGLDDVVHVDPGRPGRASSVVSVLRSTGTRFGPAEEWGRWPARMAPGYAPELLGSTIP